MRLSYGSTDFCFQGDIEDKQEKVLAGYSQDLNCEVYLAGHHGSRYASSAPWLAKMDPEWSVVSSGPNSYGHPTKEALRRIHQAGARVYITRDLGTVSVETDGTSVKVMPDTPDAKDNC
jgi:competence protein ComEC